MLDLTVQDIGLGASSRLSEEETLRLHPLKLAFVGDAVFEYYIRSYLVLTKNLNTHKIAMYSSRFVRATAQNSGLMALRPHLTEEEWEVVIRGRNQNPKTVPKHASVGEYRNATGLETLIGYLAFTGRQRRLEELVGKYIQFIEETEAADEG